MTTLHFLKEPERDPHVPRAPDTAHIAFFRKASRLLAWASVSLAILGLIDTLLGGHAAAEHHHLWHHYLPHQSLSSLIGFLLLGFGVIAAHAVRAPGRWKVQVGLGAAVILLNVLSTNLFTGTVWRQSGLTTWVILLLGFSLVTGASRLPIIGYVRQSALFAMFFLSGLVVVGHAYELAGSAPYLAN
ncbi:MAG TPA: hypothetical protein VKZ88_05660, partial [Fibrobacteria bacterium]|nr:hypothetical protein [Fibrobacteria bacterium]